MNEDKEKYFFYLYFLSETQIERFYQLFFTNFVRIFFNRLLKTKELHNKTAKKFIFSDEYFMKIALKEAQTAFEEGEIPVGAVVVIENTIIAKAHNQTERLTDISAHAEIMAITAAAGFLGAKYLVDARLYVTLEPCVMCAGALAWAQLGTLIYGATDEKRGFSRLSENILHPKTKIISNILKEDCEEILKIFFKQLR